MITQKQRDAYRFALEDKGMPEVLAFMASENLTSFYEPAELSLYALPQLLAGGFYWDVDNGPFDFWACVFADCRAA